MMATLSLEYVVKVEHFQFVQTLLEYVKVSMNE